jgi:hypothetical protein
VSSRPVGLQSETLSPEEVQINADPDKQKLREFTNGRPTKERASGPMKIITSAGDLNPQ